MSIRLWNSMVAALRSEILPWPAARSTLQSPNAPMPHRILYIEDEAHLARIVTESLERKGFEVLHRKDGTRLHENLQSFQPDACVLDVMLPHIDGFTLGGAIRNLYPDLPII